MSFANRSQENTSTRILRQECKRKRELLRSHLGTCKIRRSLPAPTTQTKPPTNRVVTLRLALCLEFNLSQKRSSGIKCNL
jgi:hypothetical protein